MCCLQSMYTHQCLQYLLYYPDPAKPLWRAMMISSTSFDALDYLLCSWTQLSTMTNLLHALIATSSIRCNVLFLFLFLPWLKCNNYGIFCIHILSIILTYCSHTNCSRRHQAASVISKDTMMCVIISYLSNIARMSQGSLCVSSDKRVLL